VIFEHLPLSVNVAIAVVLGVSLVGATPRLTDAIARSTFLVLGAVSLFGAGFIYGVALTVGGLDLGGLLP
jgi:hypothetical protein